MSGECVGAIVCKLDYHRGKVCKRGYIAMLAVDERHRKRKIGSTLVRKAIHAMQAQDADEVSSHNNILYVHCNPLMRPTDMRPSEFNNAGL